MRQETRLLILAAVVILLIRACHGMAEAHHENVAPEAARYRRQIVGEWRRVWGLWADPSVAFGQIHQESRFKPDARSKYAAGLAQFTPPTAADMQRWYPAELREVCAEAGGCPLSPGWAIRSLCLYDRRLWLAVADTADVDRWAFVLAGYNGGAGWLVKERRAAAAQGLDPNQWWGQVEGVCLRAAWACAENRDYPRRILLAHAPRYRAWLAR